MQGMRRPVDPVPRQSEACSSRRLGHLRSVAFACRSGFCLTGSFPALTALRRGPGILYAGHLLLRTVAFLSGPFASRLLAPPSPGHGRFSAFRARLLTRGAFFLLQLKALLFREAFVGLDAFLLISGPQKIGIDAGVLAPPEVAPVNASAHELTDLIHGHIAHKLPAGVGGNRVRRGAGCCPPGTSPPERKSGG